MLMLPLFNPDAGSFMEIHPNKQQRSFNSLSLPDGLLLTESKSLYNECSREQAVYNSQQDRKSHFTPETITSIMLLSPLSYQHPVEYNTTICDMNDFM
jgi:hypothetical protein